MKAFMLFDLWVMALSLALAAVPVAHRAASVSLATFLSIRVKVANILLFLAFLFAWHFIFAMLGLYQSKRLGDRKSEVKDVIRATLWGTLLITFAALLFRIRMITPLFLVVFWVGSSSITIACRLALRYFLGWVRTHGRNLRQIVIVGTNSRAVRFARTIEGKPDLGYRFVGFVDESWAGSEDFRKTGYSVVSDLEHFPHFLREGVIDEVALALPMKSFYAQASRIATLCEEQGVVIRFLSNIFDLRGVQAKGNEFDAETVVTAYMHPFEGWPMVIKRVLDVVTSLAGLVLLAPVFLVTAVLVKWGSPGPVFFAQERVGLNKRRFRMYKFRTMAVDAEQKRAELEDRNEVGGPVFKIMDDPRVTLVGKFLRKTSIDELPQLFNVVKGDMSLVGPRPLPVRDYLGFDQDWQRRRFSVRPGITCLWQVNGRSTVPFEHWMGLDMQYIDQWSLWLDLKILAKTIPAVLRGTGAA
ncbi:MAG: sugar transferase [Acidobacteria bacterium]|nr:sugar transferase [Acidobacteriota bacterium]